METLYTSTVHGFPNLSYYSNSYFSLTGDEGILSLVVVLATSVSLVTLVFAFITYSLFSDIRTLSGTTLMTVLASMFMSQLIYVVGVGGIQERDLCLSISFSLQYLDLATLCWFSALCHETYCIIYRQYMGTRLVDKPEGMCRKFLMTSLFAWGSPAAAVLAAYVMLGNGSVKPLYKLNCWFLEKQSFIATYLIPATSLLVTICLLLVRSRVRLEYTLAMETEPRARARLSRRMRHRISLLIKIFTILALLVTLSTAVRFSTRNETWVWMCFNIAKSSQGALIGIFSACHSRAMAPNNSKKWNSRTQPTVTRSASVEALLWSPIPDTV